MSAQALQAEPGAGGLVLLPYLDGERTPNRPDATGVLRGVTTQNMTGPNLARAAIEAVLGTLAEVADLIAAQGASRQRVLLIGGGARSEAARRIAPTHLRRPGAGARAGRVRGAGRGPAGGLGAGRNPGPPRLAAAPAGRVPGAPANRVRQRPAWLQQATAELRDDGRLGPAGLAAITARTPLMAYEPTPRTIPSGIWTVGGRQGVDVFGGAVRPPMPADRAVRKLAELGAYGVNFHDNDVFPFEASDANATGRSPTSAGHWTTPAWWSRRRRRTCSATRSSRTAVHRQRPQRAPVRAGPDDAQPGPGGRPGGGRLRVLGRPGGRRVRRGQGRARRAGPVQGGPGPALPVRPQPGCSACSSPSSPSRTSRAATSCCPRPATPSRSSTSSTHAEMVGINPEVGHEQMACLNYAHASPRRCGTASCSTST